MSMKRQLMEKSHREMSRGFWGKWDWLATESNDAAVPKGVYVSRVWCVPSIDKDERFVCWLACSRKSSTGEWVVAYLWMYFMEDTHRYERRVYVAPMSDEVSANKIGEEMAKRMADYGKGLPLDRVDVRTDDWVRINSLLSGSWLEEGMRVE